jgi:hypothetical protein
MFSDVAEMLFNAEKNRRRAFLALNNPLKTSIYITVMTL